MAVPKERPPQSPPPSTGLGDSGGDEIDLALSMRAMRGDLRAASFLRKSGQEPITSSIDLGSMKTAGDLVQAQGKIVRAAARGQISAGDAKKLGDQVELLGKALERDQFARKLSELSAKVGTTKKAVVHKLLNEQASLLEGQIKAYIKKEDQSWEEFHVKHGSRAFEVFITNDILGRLYLLSGMGHLEFIRLGVDNLLPRSMQEIFDNLGDFVRPKENTTSLTRRRFVSKFAAPDRWKPSGWSCNCRNISTAWVQSDLRFADNLQIYCDACHKLAGWGTPQEFKCAQEEGLASLLDRAQEALVAKLKPAPVMGVEAYLKAKNIRFASDRKDDIDEPTLDDMDDE
ncbi:MAG: hypothetical protein ORN52_09130 [Beijerinckiaceae bacterium]|nr:hypothetical protein [Beijerinckiaceae bacterium]